MADTKFTPGPWSASEKGFVFSDAVKPSAVVVSCGEPIKGEITNGVGCMVGDVRGERMANAHLIAASPEMYEAIEGFLSAHDAVLNVCQNPIGTRAEAERVDEAFAAQQKAIAVLRQALAKARGEA